MFRIVSHFLTLFWSARSDTCENVRLLTMWREIPSKNVFGEKQKDEGINGSSSDVDTIFGEYPVKFIKRKFITSIDFQEYE